MSVPPVPDHEQYPEAWSTVVKDFQVPGVTPAIVRCSLAYTVIRYSTWRFQDGRPLFGVTLIGLN